VGLLRDGGLEDGGSTARDPPCAARACPAWDFPLIDESSVHIIGRMSRSVLELCGGSGSRFETGGTPQDFPGGGWVYWWRCTSVLSGRQLGIFSWREGGSAVYGFGQDHAELE